MATYTPLQTVTLTSDSASVTFSSIDQTYTDLVVVGNTINASSDGALTVQFNGDTGTNYSETFLYGTGSSTAATSRNTSASTILIGRTGTSQSSSFFHINNYSNSTVYKTAIGRGDNPGAITFSSIGLWRSTAAITSIKIANEVPASFTAGSTFSLYGIRSGGTSKAAGGDIVVSDGTYWYHAFTKTGVFTPAVPNLSCDYLVVAGGGGGGSNAYSSGTRDAGGGGAGGLRSTVTATGGGGTIESALTLSTISYPVLIGAGGAGGTVSAGDPASGKNGSNSSFGTIFSTGGGGGGGTDTAGASVPSNGANSGGSGGGASNGNNVGAGTTSQGFAGGLSYHSAGNFGGGGGGGAGGAGNAATSNAGAAGGVGVSISAFASTTGTGVSNYYAGGGGGSGPSSQGAGGSGGGGSANGGAGSFATGGGGSAAKAGTGGAGGSGIVIVRYAV